MNAIRLLTCKRIIKKYSNNNDNIKTCVNSEI